MLRERKFHFLVAIGVAGVVLLWFGLARESVDKPGISPVPFLSPDNSQTNPSGDGAHAPETLDGDIGRKGLVTQEIKEHEDNPPLEQTDIHDAFTRYEALLPAARAGEAKAQYQLAVLTRSCMGRAKTQEEIESALADNVMRGEIDAIRGELEAGLRMCARLAANISDLYGESNSWRESAAANGDPLALADVALTSEQDQFTTEQRAELLGNALRARPKEALQLATQYVANFAVTPNPAEAIWANDAWWLAECYYSLGCDHAATLDLLYSVRLEHEIDEILRRERLIIDSVESGVWSNSTLAELAISVP